MQKTSLTALARHQLDIALQSSSGRSAETVYGGHERILRQTMIALRAGAALSEHANPGEATVYVFSGRVLLTAGVSECTGSAGDLLTMPEGRHALQAVEDSVVVLTVAKLGQQSGGPTS
ncbi:cupin domain-containing protein [Paenarthrobacter sp. PH39-S1]|uniref:cupin domain-containing protein n=1 Tax=Micrococcaceae TaxID=1268 RepID=UPI0024BA0EE7|nr:cupin domain-containing protein [Paenarthrobacter sp. PH39-S1]MDJ0356791.1 cupin domain-containing protein [Paenarthrobacter sp. PH39-S1]